MLLEMSVVIKMLEINAKENAVVDVVNGKFPLGQKNTLLIHILDKVITERLKIVGTGTCAKGNDFYSYGTFEREDSLNHVILDLNPNSFVNIVSGAGQNYSRCLYCQSDADIGTVELSPNMFEIEPNKKYILSFYARTVSGDVSIIGRDGNDDLIFNVKTDVSNEWKFYKQEFTATDSVFNAFVSIITGGECYIDNFSLFEADKELKDVDCPLNVKLCIINPCQRDSVKEINRVINWYEDEDSVSVKLYFPPEITNVDYADNILCKLEIYQRVQPRYIILENSIYEPEYNLIYNSEPFVFNGYILPPDIDYNIDVDLIVGKI